MDPLRSTARKWQVQNPNPDLMKARDMILKFTEHSLYTRDFACILSQCHDQSRTAKLKMEY